MERAELIHSLNQFRAEHADAQARAQQALAEADALAKIIEGIEGLINGDIGGQLPIAGEAFDRLRERVQPAVPLRGQEAVRRIMSETRRVWKVPALTEELQRRGWIDPEAKNPRAAVFNSVRRLEAKGEVVKSGSGRYRYKTPDAEGGDEEGG